MYLTRLPISGCSHDPGCDGDNAMGGLTFCFVVDFEMKIFRKKTDKWNNIVSPVHGAQTLFCTSDGRCVLCNPSQLGGQERGEGAAVGRTSCVRVAGVPSVEGAARAAASCWQSGPHHGRQLRTRRRY